MRRSNEKLRQLSAEPGGRYQRIYRVPPGCNSRLCHGAGSAATIRYGRVQCWQVVCFENRYSWNDSATSHELLQTPAPGGALSLKNKFAVAHYEAPPPGCRSTKEALQQWRAEKEAEAAAAAATAAAAAEVMAHEEREGRSAAQRERRAALQPYFSQKACRPTGWSRRSLPGA